MRLSVAGVLLLIAAAFPLLLNGQVFTNSVVGIVFALCAVVVASVSYSRADPKTTKQFWCVLTGSVAVVLIVALAVKLPKAYEFQTSFNRHIDDPKQRHVRTHDRPIEQQRVESLNSEGERDETN